EMVSKRTSILRYVGQLSRDLAELCGNKADSEKLKEKLLKLVEGKYSVGKIEEAEAAAEAVEPANGGAEGKTEKDAGSRKPDAEKEEAEE
ncbi:MAG: hypothetical protein NTY83_03535, partial [Candidatus Micrarchaeota archaeon]|nr:hypothetical protein [Candidatus Micrarchaeota archaeon]